MKTSFELQISEIDEFIRGIYKEESLGDVLPLHELISGAFVERNLTFYMEEYITLSYVYELDSESAMSVMNYYKDSLDGAEESKVIACDDEALESISANVDGVDISVSLLDDGRIELWYGLVE
jgi:hypothetical protein